MADAIRIRDRHDTRITSAAAVASGEIYQLPDGRAAVYTGLNSAASGDRVNFTTTGVFTVTKNNSTVLLDGQPVYWDHSANEVVHAKANDRDFFLGSVRGDAASTDTTCEVNLNVWPTYALDLLTSPYDTAVVGTAAAGGLSDPKFRGGALKFELTATNEAQKVDALTKDGVAPAANWIVEGEVEVVNDGSGSNTDVSIGIANGTHASDADSITESVFIHLDGNNVNINAESDDGTTEVAATDTTVDYTAGTRFHFMMDGRDPSDVQIYINGSLVLSGTTFDVSAATGPWKLLVHVEKSTSTDVYEIDIDSLRLRIAEI